MNNIALGQYIHKDSVIHKLDPRCKLLYCILQMIVIFLIPSPLKSKNIMLSFAALTVILVILLICVILTKISLLKFLNSIKQILFLLLITLVIQMLIQNNSDMGSYNITLHYSIIKILAIALLLFLFIFFRKKLKAKLLLFSTLVILSFVLLSVDLKDAFATSNIVIYQYGLYVGAFFIMRIFLAITTSTLLTLTTKPTDLTAGIEWLLSPLKLFKVNVSIFGMLISLSLRFIPTLFNEANKILKAQASRGVDFKEGSLKEQITQIISLLIPMFVISYNRAIDLADAMEARAYVPGNPRTKINILRFKLNDFFAFFVVLMLLVFVIVWRILYAI